MSVIAGRLVSNAVVRGKKTRLLVFTVATEHLNANREVVNSYARCVCFGPEPELEQMLTTRGKDMRIELQARINTSRPEENGDLHSNAVVVYNSSVRITAEPVELAPELVASGAD